ncbi:MAG: OmpA family protein [Gammaproteobacteria bacterium]|nr:OmpA family protein [Gammaproteobacteria bacterium]
MEFRAGHADEEFAPWSVLSDISITMVLFLVIFIVLQFLQTYRDSAINRQLRLEKETVAHEIVTAAGAQVILDTTDSPERQRLTFRDATLFETCQSALKPGGQELLEIVGSVLARHEALFLTVSVEGHTDTLPTPNRAGCSYATNWELSSARATSVVALWSANGLITNAKMSSVGKAEFHPIDPQALERNRRIEVLLTYDRGYVQRRVLGDDR